MIDGQPDIYCYAHYCTTVVTEILCAFVSIGYVDRTVILT